MAICVKIEYAQIMSPGPVCCRIILMCFYPLSWQGSYLYVVTYRPAACSMLMIVTIWWYEIVRVWSQEGTVLSSLGWAPLVDPPTQLPAHQSLSLSLSLLACVPFCVEQIPNLTVFKNHYFWKHVGLIHCACISIDRPVELLPLDTGDWTTWCIRLLPDWA